jgi:hypothetical protein
MERAMQKIFARFTKIFWWVVITAFMIISLLLFIIVAVICSPALGIKTWNDGINKMARVAALKGGKHG